MSRYFSPAFTRKKDVGVFCVENLVFFFSLLSSKNTRNINTCVSRYFGYVGEYARTSVRCVSDPWKFKRELSALMKFYVGSQEDRSHELSVTYARGLKYSYSSGIYSYSRLLGESAIVT